MVPPAVGAHRRPEHADLAPQPQRHCRWLKLSRHLALPLAGRDPVGLGTGHTQSSGQRTGRAWGVSPALKTSAISACLASMISSSRCRLWPAIWPLSGSLLMSSRSNSGCCPSERESHQTPSQPADNSETTWENVRRVLRHACWLLSVGPSAGLLCGQRSAVQAHWTARSAHSSLCLSAAERRWTGPPTRQRQTRRVPDPTCRHSLLAGVHHNQQSWASPCLEQLAEAVDGVPAGADADTHVRRQAGACPAAVQLCRSKVVPGGRHRPKMRTSTLLSRCRALKTRARFLGDVCPACRIRSVLRFDVHGLL